MKKDSRGLALRVRRMIIRIIAVLLVLLILAAGTVVATMNYRGNTESYIVPTEFVESLKSADTLRYGKNSIRIMSSNILVHYESWGGTDAHKRSKMYFEMLKYYSPDVVAVQEMSDQWYCCIMKNKGSYKMLFPLSTGALVRMTGIIYNSDTVNLLEKGQIQFENGDNSRLRRVVWGLFEDKDTAKQFVVTSTHFDLIREGQEKSELKVMQSQSNQQINISKELQKKYAVPVFSAGDFNAMDKGGYDEMYDAPSIYDALSDKMTDTKYIAKNKTEGNSWSTKQPTYDHIFLCGKARINRYAIISDRAMDAMSDHYPIFVDATF